MASVPKVIDLQRVTQFLTRFQETLIPRTRTWLRGTAADDATGERTFPPGSPELGARRRQST